MIIFFILLCRQSRSFARYAWVMALMSSIGCYAAVNRHGRITSRSDMTWQSHSPRRRRITLQNMILNKRLNSLVFS